MLLYSYLVSSNPNNSYTIMINHNNSHVCIVIWFQVFRSNSNNFLTDLTHR